MKKRILILSLLCTIFCCIIAVSCLNGIKASADNIGVTTYNELISAIESASSGDTILLDDEIEITSKIDIDKSLTFRPSGNRSRLIYTGQDQVSLLNDNTNANYRHFNILAGARVTFNKCDFLAGYDVYGGGVYCDGAGAIITFSNCAFESSENIYGGAVCIDSDINMINCGFTQCSFKGNQAERGGAVYVRNAAVYFEVCTFEDNVAINDGSAICVDNYKATAEAIITINRSEFNKNITKSTDNKKAGVISLCETYTEIENDALYSESLALGFIQNCKFVSNIALKSGYESPCGAVIYVENYLCGIDSCELTTNTNQGDAIIMAVYTTAKPSFNLKNSLIQQNYVYGNACALSFKSDVDCYFKVSNCVFIDNLSKDGENILYGPYTSDAEVTIDAMVDELTIIKNTNTNLPALENSNDNENKIFTWINVVLLIIAIAGIITSIILARRKQIITVVPAENSVESDKEILNKTEIEHVDNKQVDETSDDVETIKEVDINSIIKEYGLTKREGDVLDLLLKGKKRGEIAEELFITTETVKTHTQNIYKKFNVKTKVELVLKLKK